MLRLGYRQAHHARQSTPPLTVSHVSRAPATDDDVLPILHICNVLLDVASHTLYICIYVHGMRRGGVGGLGLTDDAGRSYGHRSVIVGRIIRNRNRTLKHSYGIEADVRGRLLLFSGRRGREHRRGSQLMGVMGLQGVSIRRGTSRASCIR